MDPNNNKKEAVIQGIMGEGRYILIVDDDLIRREQLEMVLAFSGEPFKVCTRDLLQENVRSLNEILSIVLCGEITDDYLDIVKQNPACPFMLFDVDDESLMDPCRNVVGHLSSPLEQKQLVNYIYRCHQYHNKLPSKKSRGLKSRKLFKTLVGVSQPIQQVRFLIEQVASTKANVLILGESGTGKEVVARSIHELSPRAKKPFVPVNCGAIPSDLLESELFGHEKGAFTGAITTRKGRFELAEGGTVFLDEIGDMPHPMQVKLLRILQERTFERIGSDKSIKADVRIIAATHQNLEDMLQKKTFREDLYYRLNVFSISMPPLRERREDIPLLIEELTEKFKQEHGAGVRFNDQAVSSLQQDNWRGNVRELANLIERMIIMYGNQVINVHQLPDTYQHIGGEEYIPKYPDAIVEPEVFNEILSRFDYLKDEIPQQRGPAVQIADVDELPEEGLNLKSYLADLEVSMLTQALERNDWVIARAAEMLDMGRTTLIEKMRKYDLKKEYREKTS
ncbi:sigma-54 dependent transcriptional regulator [Thalassotalea agarivorans]|uniref:Sigma-54 specific transcriptional regulator, flagellar regulatory protein A n=1 Tax=Thalassotalea agarivorans TaxID=349064 RepID=A0A1H9Z7J7_THASX|nr:sigma-54 dependent transcriptional regulator [Thalassotalea agarivorans]SES77526.1 sigma-54 specific transcriptional regulator, flagellar regulatory protein A [Thalassotalea agarivorans]